MKSRRTDRPVRVGLISLGCAKNLVDSEIMLGSLMAEGVEITPDASQADVVIVNTCSFIDSAQEESIDAILESAALREASNRCQGLIVSGCLPQRFRDELPKLLPEVDAFMGIDQVGQIAHFVRKALEHRRQRLVGRSPTSSVPDPKPAISERFAALDRALSNSQSHDSISRTTRVDPARGALKPPNPAAGASTRHLDTPPVEVSPRPTYLPDFATPRFRLTPKHFAYLKIAEGCNHPCSFCIIPRMRGSHRSRPRADIVREARQLLATGVKELNLVSQDSTYYGLDLRPNPSRAIAAPDRFTTATRSLRRDAPTLCTLLRDLNSLPGDFWIRLLYTHPAHWTDELIQTIAECQKVARYVDIPLQHIHHNMLERMRRETSQAYLVDLIGRIRAGLPGITLRTTFIVGFPGETQAYFQTLLEFIREARFERLGVFAYSKEEGTRAGNMADQIPDRIKQQRCEIAMAEQLQVARTICASFVGRTIKVLVENEASAEELKNARCVSWEHGLIRHSRTPSAELQTQSVVVARGEADAPDIDGRVYARGDLPVGEFAPVKVIGHTDYDLIAEPA
jgi:ribosomal protein S12 methylthiotransferase